MYTGLKKEILSAKRYEKFISTSMKDNLNRRKPQWKKTPMEENLNGRQSQGKLTSTKDALS